MKFGMRREALRWQGVLPQILVRQALRVPVHVHLWLVRLLVVMVLHQRHALVRHWGSRGDKWKSALGELHVTGTGRKLVISKHLVWMLALEHDISKVARLVGTQWVLEDDTLVVAVA